MGIHDKQVAALNLAIRSLTSDRRRLYAAGDHAWLSGLRTDTIQDDEVSGELFSFAEDGHKSYEEYTEAIQQLEDMIEIFTDPGVVRQGFDDLPLFQEAKQ